MAKTPVIFFIYYIGAVTLWLISGFKGKVSSYLPGPYERSNKSTKALIAGIVMTFLLFTLALRFVDIYESSQPYVIPGLTPEQTRKVLEKTNGTGKIVIKPEQLEEFVNTLDSVADDSIK